MTSALNDLKIRQKTKALNTVELLTF